jgi:hypothetical protein
VRKTELIKLLNKIEGNPEIMLWNGHVSDYMNIDPKLVPGTLVRYTQEHYIEMCRCERCVDLQDFTFQFSEEEIEELKTAFKQNIQWEHNDSVSQLDILAVLKDGDSYGAQTKHGSLLLFLRRLGGHTSTQIRCRPHIHHLTFRGKHEIMFSCHPEAVQRYTIQQTDSRIQLLLVLGKMYSIISVVDFLPFQWDNGLTETNQGTKPTQRTLN